MSESPIVFNILSAICLSAGYTSADEHALNPQVARIMDEVSEQRIHATIEKLVSFQTRNSLSNPDDPVHGVGAARQWIFNELASYSPKLQVRFDVQQAVLTLRATKVAIDASREALTNAREQLRLAEGRYQSGVGSIIELGDAQIAATNAAAQVVQADFNLATARAQLLTALGRP